MERISEKQLHTLSKDALILLISSMQDRLFSMQDQLDTANDHLAEMGRQISILNEQIRIMNQRRFGKKSESALSENDGQISIFDLFNEAEYLLKEDLKEPEITEVVISSYKRTRTKGKREADLEGLPARVIDHTLPEEELAALFPDGYKELPHEVYKRLGIVPETFYVDEHHVHVYASKKDDSRIVKAPRPKDLLRNSIATAPLAASVMNGKFANALPLDRQSRIFKTNGIRLSTNTLANWVIRCSEDYLSLLFDFLHRFLYGSRVIHADETPVKVMRINGEKISGGKKTYMWVYRTSPKSDSHPVILFDWQPSRKADHPKEFLKRYSGTVVTDGYQVYHKLGDELPDLKIAGCWIHARRPFAEFIKSVKPQAAKGSVAQEAYDMITEMLHIDNGFDDLPSEDRLTQRRLKLKPRVDAFFEWVKLKYTQVAHNGATGKALAYSINQEPYLRTFLDDADVPMDNNPAEQAIRPFTIGRKNFVLIETDNGAKASAMIYSIIETAKANNLNTYKYLELLLTIIPKHMDDKDMSFLYDLLPWSDFVQKECRSQNKQS